MKPSTKVPRYRLPLLFFGYFICGQFFLSKFLIVPEEPASSVIFPDASHCLFLISAVILIHVITITDLEQHLIFDITTVPLAGLGLLQSVLYSYTSASFSPLQENLLAAVGGGLAFLLLALLTRGGIGGGDVKLVAALGLWLGPYRLINITCIGLFLGGLIALLLIITKQKKKSDTFAYGPCFTIPALISLLTGLF